MAVLTAAGRHHRARIAALSRRCKADDPQLIDERRSFAADRLAATVLEVVASAPPLTDEQRDRIVAILRSGAPS
jgi:hypothetical protein